MAEAEAAEGAMGSGGGSGGSFGSGVLQSATAFGTQAMWDKQSNDNIKTMGDQVRKNMQKAFTIDKQKISMSGVPAAVGFGFVGGSNQSNNRGGQQTYQNMMGSQLNQSNSTVGQSMGGFNNTYTTKNIYRRQSNR